MPRRLFSCVADALEERGTLFLRDVMMSGGVDMPAAISR